MARVTADRWRAAFIRATVGAEVCRAAAHCRSLHIAAAFAALVETREPEIDRVDIFWWAPDRNRFAAETYKLSAAGLRNVRPGPGALTGPYLPTCQLPTEPDWQLVVVVHLSDDLLDKPKQEVEYVVKRDTTARDVAELDWQVMGAIVLS
jgi:hypothetical protein